MPSPNQLTRYYDVKRDEHGQRYVEVHVTGFPLLQIPLLNKSTGFSLQERRELDIDGLVPPHINSLSEQKERTYQAYGRQTSDIGRHEFLRALQDRNEVLFYSLLIDHLEEMLPILYTPTVGEAVRNFSSIYRYPRGLAVSTSNVGHVEEVINNVPLNDVRMIVATDSSAILGIGDQGFGGMAISIGKLSLYIAAGGLGLDKTLPVELDVGTDREDLLADPLYLGQHHRRLTGRQYDEFLDRFVEAVAERYPQAIVQWEDFSRNTAFHVLERYRRVIPSFNDDIQGTGAMAVAGLVSAARQKGETLKDQVFVVVGNGAGGIGVAGMIRQGLLREGLSDAEVQRRLYVVAREGLMIEGRGYEQDTFQQPFIQPRSAVEGWQLAGEQPTLLETVQNAGATAVLGLTGAAGLFGEELVRAMLANTARPIIFPLSNPTSHIEAHPADLLRWTDGAAIIATGSPFDPIEHGGQTYRIGQGNNAFIFPGLGFGAVMSRAREITDGMVMEAAQTLADWTAEHSGPDAVFPVVSQLRAVSEEVAVRVARQAITEGVSAERRIRNMTDEALADFIREHQWTPEYLPFRRSNDAELALGL
ncbi:NAD-dependent malic enzyme [Deinococcus sp. SL84]|uniref:NAD-dependent malic enzyme n=1 Tax=Deinococcus sp. SL84 TaxID=2994663 RepID=UPI00227287B1|nr:NAD-dependent malic enzyme [Deinococcus sp. SL84]MCY1701790.1 NAD-dependent malic enzyme [Deinococcus sp. SL84]